MSRAEYEELAAGYRDTVLTAFRQVEYAGVLKGAANPEGGKAFVTWMLSKAVQEDIPGQMYMYPVLPDAALPRRHVAWTQCFRSEAGAAGRSGMALLAMRAAPV